MTGKERIIVALDQPNRTACQELVTKLGSEVQFVKVGSVLFSAEGPPLLEEITAKGLKLFLDLKFHDIPNTVAGAVSSVCRLAPLSFLTLHASGGGEMIRAARRAVDKSEAKTKPKILAVTVLTSLSASHLQEIGFRSTDPKEMVPHLAKLAVDAGADGIVCSPQEVALVRGVVPKEVKLVVPGIRPATSNKGDQQRTATPKDAIGAGADYLVIGRPITAAEDPAAAFRLIAAEIDS